MMFIYFIFAPLRYLIADAVYVPWGKINPQTMKKFPMIHVTISINIIPKNEYI